MVLLIQCQLSLILCKLTDCTTNELNVQQTLSLVGLFCNKSYDSRADVIVITAPHGGRWGWMMGQGCDGLWMCFMSNALTGTFQTTLEFNWSFVESAQSPGTLGVFTTVLSLKPISGRGIVVACGCGACCWWKYVCFVGVRGSCAFFLLLCSLSMSDIL